MKYKPKKINILKLNKFMNIKTEFIKSDKKENKNESDNLVR